MASTNTRAMMPSLKGIAGMTDLRKAARKRQEEMEAMLKSGTAEIAIDKIDTEKQVRAQMNLEGIESLMGSIEENGLLSPITLKKKEDNRYLVVAGHRRLEACKRLGHRTIAAIVKDVDPKDMAILQLTENIAREDLKPHEIGDAIVYLRDTLNMKQKDIANKIGMSPANVSKYASIAAAAEEVRQLSELGTVKDVVVLYQLQQLLDKNPAVAHAVIEKSEFNRAMLEKRLKRLDEDSRIQNPDADQVNIFDSEENQSDSANEISETENTVHTRRQAMQVSTPVSTGSGTEAQTDNSSPTQNRSRDDYYELQLCDRPDDGLENSTVNDPESGKNSSDKDESDDVDIVSKTKTLLENATLRRIMCVFEHQGNPPVECELNFDKDSEVNNGVTVVPVIVEDKVSGDYRELYVDVNELRILRIEPAFND